VTDLNLERVDAHHFDSVRSLLLELYAEVYTDVVSKPFFTVEAFATRLDHHAANPTWEAVVGRQAGDPVGYAYGSAVAAGTSWWTGVDPPPGGDVARETGGRTFVLYELMVRVPWRRTGVSRRLHDELLAARGEDRVTLAVERAHPRVRALYEGWGYQWIGSVQDAPDAPLYDVLLRQRAQSGQRT
jgi:GNAT superfamily N-acetyltransferase